MQPIAVTCRRVSRGDLTVAGLEELGDLNPVRTHWILQTDGEPTAIAVVRRAAESTVLTESSDLVRIGNEVQRGARRTPSRSWRRAAPVVDRETPAAETEQRSVLEQAFVDTSELLADRADVVQSRPIQFNPADFHTHPVWRPGLTASAESRPSVTTPPSTRSKRTPSGNGERSRCRIGFGRHPAGRPYRRPADRWRCGLSVELILRDRRRLCRCAPSQILSSYDRRASQASRGRSRRELTTRAQWLLLDEPQRLRQAEPTHR